MGAYSASFRRKAWRGWRDSHTETTTGCKRATSISNARVFVGDDEGGDQRVTAEKPDKSFKSSDCVLEDFVRVPVDLGTLCPVFGLVHRAPENVHDNDGRFTALRVLGRLMKMRLHGLFADNDDCTSAANITGQAPSFGRETWRGVTTPEVSDSVAEWASVEHPAFQADTFDGAILALIVVVVRRVQGGWFLGNFGSHLTAYEVLYLQRAQALRFEPEDRDCYERIGVGRLFGDEVGMVYAVTNRSTIWLV
ncbi:hypothetical protein ANO14919_119000 [Xylariales sp. No.14919]|nr:hypothetical protein ANO14919_119000 [Xylariales sp. No.14919]